jgi:hypothetical protein
LLRGEELGSSGSEDRSASSSEMIRRMEAKISSIDGSLTFRLAEPIAASKLKYARITFE